MAGKLTMKLLSKELDALRKQFSKLEKRMERRLETALEKAADRLKQRTGETGAVGATPGVDVDTRRRMIEQCAYLRAERRGFIGGDPRQDWLEAEVEIDRMLLQRELRPGQTTPQQRAPNA